MHATACLLQIVKVYPAAGADGAGVYDALLDVVEQQGCQQEGGHHIDCPGQLKAVLALLHALSKDACAPGGSHARMRDDAAHATGTRLA